MFLLMLFPSVGLEEEVLGSFGNPCPRVDGAYSE